MKSNNSNFYKNKCAGFSKNTEIQLNIVVTGILLKFLYSVTLGQGGKLPPCFFYAVNQCFINFPEPSKLPFLSFTYA